jgi:hypothetical protein
MRGLGASVVGLVVLVLATSMVLVRAAGAKATPPARVATAADRADLALNITVNEAQWRTGAEEAFPEDNWSQSDDFHGREAGRIREIARERGFAYEDVLRGVDEDLHRGGTKVGERRGARAVQCKPRPFYD